MRLLSTEAGIRRLEARRSREAQIGRREIGLLRIKHFPRKNRRVAVIGGGISGLAAAHRILEVAPETEVLLFESGKRLGGVIQTHKQDGYLIESAADNFITTTGSATALCERLGLGDELISTKPTGRKAMVVRKGKLRPIPSGFLVMAPSRLWPLMCTRILSPLGKIRSALEMFIPRKRTDEDESLKSFICRRFGREMFERLVQPLVGGIYTADPNQLSVAATMPRFLRMEREHGSLIRAMLRQRKSGPREKSSEDSSGARYGQFAALRGGMSTLIDALANRLPEESIRFNSPVSEIVRNADGGWTVFTGGEFPTCEDVDGVIVAAPAHHAARMLRSVDETIAENLREIEYASCAVVSLAFRRDQIKRPLNSFGFVVPLAENRLILSCSFSSQKYDGRAPNENVLMRVFIGGACQGGLVRLPHDELIELARREVSSLLKIKGKPVMAHFTRQSRAMPQYHIGHCERISKIDERLEEFPTLQLAGSSLRGVSVPGCIESGEVAAEKVMESFTRKPQSEMVPQ